MRMIGIPDIATAEPRLPPENVERYWPLLVVAMTKEGIASPPALIGLAATVAVETAFRFAPIEEFSPRGEDRVAYFERRYGWTTRVGMRLGNDRPGDGHAYRGRAFLQLTGRTNYRTYGLRLGLPLEREPELAMDPVHAARIAAAYFKDRGVARAADQLDWRAVRKLVNGGYNGWEEFAPIVDRLVALARQRGGDVYPLPTVPPALPPPAPHPAPAPAPEPDRDFGVREGPPVLTPAPTAPDPRPTLLGRLRNVLRGRSPFDPRP